MDKNGIVYRPVWTCGRYHEKSHSALLYNLLAGYSFFFEDDSADIVRFILETPRGSAINLEELAITSGINLDLLTPFFNELETVGLICYKNLCDNDIETYKEKYNDDKIARVIIPDDLYGQITISDAEKAYAERSHCQVGEVLIELTYLCSEQCVHCYNPGASRNGQEISTRGQHGKLSLAGFKRIIDQLYDEGTFRVTLSGGDPFSFQWIWEAIDYLYKKGIAFEVFTNGQKLFGQEERLAAYFPLDVGVSLYAGDAKIHDSVTRIPGSYLKSIHVLEKLHDLKVPLIIKCCLMRQNVKYYTGVISIAYKLGAEIQIDHRVFDSVDGDRCASTFLRLTPEQMKIVLQDPNNPMYVDIKQQYNNRFRNMNEPACKAGVNSICITAEGDVIPCVCYRKPIGNLLVTSLAEILSNKVLFDDVVRMPISVYEQCGKHEYCAFCMLCPGLNYGENGDARKASETSCYFAKIRHDLYLSLKDGKDVIESDLIQQALEELPDENFDRICRIRIR